MNKFKKDTYTKTIPIPGGNYFVIEVYLVDGIECKYEIVISKYKDGIFVDKNINSCLDAEVFNNAKQESEVDLIKVIIEAITNSIIINRL